MAWLLFMDESGHDHKAMPYELRGGFALKDSELWPFVQDVMHLEMLCFGARLSDYKSEIKGSKLLQKERFKHAQQLEGLDDDKRRAACRALLQAGLDF